MSTRQVGNARENRVAEILEALGYCCYPSRGSRGIDIIALHNEYGHPHLAIAVVRPSGSVKENFAKMEGYTMPAGAVRLAVREVTKKIHRWYARDDHRGGWLSAQSAIDEARTL